MSNISIQYIIADNGSIVRFPLIIRNLNAVFKNCLWLIKKLLARLLVIISFKKAIWWSMFLLHASLLQSISPHQPQKVKWGKSAWIKSFLTTIGYIQCSGLKILLRKSNILLVFPIKNFFLYLFVSYNHVCSEWPKS